MRKFILLLSLLPLKVLCQSDSLPKNAEGKYEFANVINVDSASSDKLYSNAKIFVALTFKSGKAVTQLNDDNTKTVVGNGITSVKLKISIGSPVYTDVAYSFTIQCKDNRYRYSITDFFFYNTGDGSSRKALEDNSYFDKNKISRRFFKSISEQINADMKDLISRLLNYMSSNTLATKSW